MVKVTLVRKGKSLERPSVIMDEAHMRAIGETIAGPVRAHLARGQDAGGAPLAPQSPNTLGSGIPGNRTGALAGSIRTRRTKQGVLMVMPDYRRYRYGIYLTLGVNTEATKKAIASGKLRKRRDYKGEGERYQPARPFMGMASSTLAQVEQANVGQFQRWFSGALGTVATKAAGTDLPGAAR
jgi:hypothetical protein